MTVNSKTLETLKGFNIMKDFNSVMEELQLRLGINTYNSTLIHKKYLDLPILITGAAGSIASALAENLLEQGAKRLILVDLSEIGLVALDRGFREDYHNLYSIHLASLGDKVAMGKIIRKHKPHTIVHCGAYKHITMVENNPSVAITNNMLATLNLMELSTIYGVDRFILLSTDKAVNPTSVMGHTKAFCEGLIPLFNCSPFFYDGIRFGNVLASGGSVVPLFYNQILHHKPLTITSPHVSRYFLSMVEAVNMIISVINIGQGGNVYVRDMGEAVNISTLANILKDIMGRQDIPINYSHLSQGEKLEESIINPWEKATETPINKLYKVSPKSLNPKTLPNQLKTLNYYLKRDYPSYKLLEFLREVNQS